MNSSNYNEIIQYCLYDVLFLKYLFIQIYKIAMKHKKPIKYIIELSKLVYLEKKDVINITKLFKVVVVIS